MNGLGKTADRSSVSIKVGAKSRSIYEALLKASGTSIFEMLREPHGGGSIYEEIRFARHNGRRGNGKGESILQKDWKNRN